jgi:hypothetical protein
MSNMASRRVINPWTWGDEFGFVQAVEIQNGARILQCAGQNEDDFRRYSEDEERKRVLHLKNASVRSTILVKGTAE